MAFEKIKLFVRKLFWLLIALAVVLFDLLLFYLSIDVKIIDDVGYSEYNETLDSSYCSVSLKFDNYAVDGSITVAFYNADGKLLSEENEDVYVLLKKEAEITFYVDGNVKYYDIVNYNIGISDYAKYEFIAVLIIAELLLILPLVISTLLLSCKIYLYDDQKIVVYAGRYHNYIKVDGVKVDEFNTFSSRVIIYLSCTLDDGTYVDVKITTSNRITLKIDNRLYKNTI